MSEEKSFSPLDYAKMSIETMMRTYSAPDLPPVGRFHYHQGVFLSGVFKNYLLCHDERYFSYIKDWVDAVLRDDGTFVNQDKGQLDDIQPGILLFPLLERTGEEKYRTALNYLADLLENFPTIPEGGYFHKDRCANQMWLDGIYMAGPISAQLARDLGRHRLYDIAHRQVMLMRDKTRDAQTGLWYHVYDDTKSASWANPQTGLSPEVWGRSVGWVPVGILDEMEFMTEDSQYYKDYGTVVSDLLETIVRYQSPSGLWYQVIDKGNEPDNWPEVSCSCLFVAALAKAVRLGVIGHEYLTAARKGYAAVISSLRIEGDDLYVQGVCIGTGVGDYSHYVHRPTSTNDLHGVGAFLLMCAEMSSVPCTD